MSMVTIKHPHWQWTVVVVILMAMVSPLGVVVLVRGCYELIGFHAWTFSGAEIAQIAIEKKDPKECARIRVFLGGNTTTYEEVQYCLYTYAKLTKDPTACELLLPSDYGLACIGAASESSPCWIAEDRSVRWNNHGGEATLKECIEQKQASKEGEQCCTIARVNSLIGFDDCSSLHDTPAMSDQCYKELAEKNFDTSLCARILSPNLRSACAVRVSALVRFPELWHVKPIKYMSE